MLATRGREDLHRWFGGPFLEGKLPLRKTSPPEIVMRKRCQRVVRAEGLEPPRLSSLEPKSSASTSSATPARIASCPAAMPGQDSRSGFRAAIMLQVDEIDQLYDVDGFIRIIKLIVAAGL
jgi:hypothetical protein